MIEREGRECEFMKGVTRRSVYKDLYVSYPLLVPPLPNRPVNVLASYQSALLVF